MTFAAGLFVGMVVALTFSLIVGGIIYRKDREDKE